MIPIEVDLRGLLLQTLSHGFSSGIMSTIFDVISNQRASSRLPFLSESDVSIFDLLRRSNFSDTFGGDLDFRITLYDYIRILNASKFATPTSTHGFLANLSFSPFVVKNVIDSIDFPDVDPILSRALDRLTDEVAERFFNDFGISSPLGSRNIPSNEAKELLDAILDFGISGYLEKFKTDDYIRSAKSTFLSILISLAIRNVGGDTVSVEFESKEIERIKVPVPTIPKKYSFAGSIPVSLVDYIILYDRGKEYTWSGFFDLFSSYIKALMFDDKGGVSSSLPIKFGGVSLGSLTAKSEALSVNSIFALSMSSALSVVKVHTAPYHISTYLVVPSSVEEPSSAYGTSELRQITVKFSPIWRMGIRINIERNRELLRIATQIIKMSDALAKFLLGEL